MKKYPLILLFCLMTRLILAQDIEDSLTNLYQPSPELIIKDKIERIEYLTKNDKYVVRYDSKTGKILKTEFSDKVTMWLNEDRNDDFPYVPEVKNLDSLWTEIKARHDSIYAVRHLTRDSFLLMSQELYYYTDKHLDSTVSTNFERSTKNIFEGFHISNETQKYDKDGNKIKNYHSEYYTEEIKQYFIDNGKTKYAIVVFPSLDSTVQFMDKNSVPSSKSDTTTYFYDDWNRLSKIKSHRLTKTFEYRQDTILVKCEDSKSDDYKKYYCFKDGNLIKVVCFIFDRYRSKFYNLGYIEEYFYKNNLLTKSYFYDIVGNDYLLYNNESDFKKNATKQITEIKIIKE